jgi:riboflavin biosynthesis pyrimidine reductase
MRRLILKMSVSVDGFVAGPNGEVDWIFPTLDEGTTRWLAETLSRAGAHLMGSRTFRDMAAYWPRSVGPIAGAMNDIPKVVFTRSGRAGLAGATSRALQDAVEARPVGTSAARGGEGAASWPPAPPARVVHGVSVGRGRAGVPAGRAVRARSRRR